MDEARATLKKLEPQFKMALPPHITPEKFTRVVSTALQLTPKLLEANRQTLYAACMKCASDGLLPDGREAALVPFGNDVVYMPMVGGICKKARNSGEISTIDAQVVRDGDEFQEWTDEKGSHFRHVKARSGRGDVLLTYAYAITKDGGFYFETIDEDQMKAIRSQARAKTTPWDGPFKDEMRRKSALRRLCKYRVPSSADLDSVIRADDELYDLEKKDEGTKDPARAERLSKIIQEKTAEPEPQPTPEPAPEETQGAAPEPAEAEIVEPPLEDDNLPI